jgi:hypothetical protein
VAIELLLGYLRRHDYTPFVIYRLVLAAAILIVIASGLAQRALLDGRCRERAEGRASLVRAFARRYPWAKPEREETMMRRPEDACCWSPCHWRWPPASPWPRSRAAGGPATPSSTRA